MQAGLLITDGGPHPADTWAIASATALLDFFRINPNSGRVAQLEIAKMRAIANVADCLLAHHAAVQRLEREKLAAGDHARLLTELDATEHTDVEQALADVFQIVKPLLESAQLFVPGSAFGEQPDMGQYVLGVIRERVETDLRSAMHIERSWHAERHPGDANAQLFRAMNAQQPAA